MEFGIFHAAFQISGPRPPEFSRRAGRTDFVILHIHDKLVAMTSSDRARPPNSHAARRGAGELPPRYWRLQEAKARLSELVRRARSDGPQHVTVRGRDEVVVMSGEEFRRLKGEPTGAALVAAIQASPCREVEIAPEPVRLPVRPVEL